MNIVKNKLLEVQGVREVLVELVPGSAEIICDENVNEENLVNKINNETSYRATFYREEDVFPEELE